MKEEGPVLMTTMGVGVGTWMSFDAKGLSIDGDWRVINGYICAFLLAFNHEIYLVIQV